MFICDKRLSQKVKKATCKQFQFDPLLLSSQYCSNLQLLSVEIEQRNVQTRAQTEPQKPCAVVSGDWRSPDLNNLSPAPPSHPHKWLSVSVEVGPSVISLYKVMYPLLVLYTSWERKNKTIIIINIHRSLCVCAVSGCVHVPRPVSVGTVQVTLVSAFHTLFVPCWSVIWHVGHSVRMSECLLWRPQSAESGLSGFRSGSCRSPSPCVWCGTVCVSACDTHSSCTGTLVSTSREHI